MSDCRCAPAPSDYTVNLVAVDGRIAGSITAARRSGPGAGLGQRLEVSASDSRLYYLDGDSRVMFWLPDGTTGVATNIQVDSSSAAIFAVSPDDSRIAVAIISYPYPTKTRIYVENLSGGGNRVELFSSSDVMEWPVGWHEGHLVIAVGKAQPDGVSDGLIFGYHVADATTGSRIVTVCKDDATSMVPVRAGTFCFNNGNCVVSDWSGARRSILPGDLGCRYSVLSPDGNMIAEYQNSGQVLTLAARDGSTTPTSYAVQAWGWIDANHVFTYSGDYSVGVLDTRSLILAATPLKGGFAGAIPGGL